MSNDKECFVSSPQLPLTTLIFDLSEVLIAGLLDIEKPLARHLGISPDGLFPAFGGQPLTDLFCGRITENAYLAQLIEKQQWGISLQTLQSLIRQNFHLRIPGMEQVIGGLAHHYELVLLSDHAEEWIAYIREIHSFLRVFAHQFYSYQFGQTKSEPSTFSKALQWMHRHPAQCLFIDDWASNLAVAEKVGLRGIRFLGAADLTQKLTELGVLAGYP